MCTPPEHRGSNRPIGPTQTNGNASICHVTHPPRQQQLVMADPSTAAMKGATHRQRPRLQRPTFNTQIQPRWSTHHARSSQRAMPLSIASAPSLPSLPFRPPRQRQHPSHDGSKPSPMRRRRQHLPVRSMRSDHGQQPSAQIPDPARPTRSCDSDGRQQPSSSAVNFGDGNQQHQAAGPPPSDGSNPIPRPSTLQQTSSPQISANKQPKPTIKINMNSSNVTTIKGGHEESK
ncbi:hypothetical protein ACLOJK_009963 [Asimina triloba]